MLFAALPLLFSRPAADAGHYFFAGPLSSLMIEGGTPGASTSGLQFTVVVSDGGTKINNDFELQGPMWDSPIHVHLNNASFAGSDLKGTVQFKNESGKVLEGLRLDVVGAVERSANGDPQGDKTEQPVLASPILFGDIQAGDDAESEDIDVSGLSLDPNMKELDVTFRLSGLAYINSFKVAGDSNSYGCVSTDAKGRVYTTEHNTGLWRTEADGSAPQMVGKWGDNTDYAFVDPTTGDLIGHESNSHRIVVTSAGGDEKGKIPAAADFDRWPSFARTFGNGTVYVQEEDHMCIFHNGNRDKDVNQIGDVNGFGDAKFDVDPAGNVYFVNESSLYKANPDLTEAKKLAFGPDWHLGRVTKVESVRVDPAGNLYVVEAAADNWTEWPRVSVFDKDGHFVRAFGRGGKNPPDGDNVLPGQVGKDQYDVAIGPDGRVYVSCDVEFGKVLVFMPF